VNDKEIQISYIGIEPRNNEGQPISHREGMGSWIDILVAGSVKTQDECPKRMFWRDDLREMTSIVPMAGMTMTMVVVVVVVVVLAMTMMIMKARSIWSGVVGIWISYEEPSR
jgi:hypothetical protein